MKAFEKVSFAIQALPSTVNGIDYQVIHKVIQHIQQSGLYYMVCPFETAIEGSFEDCMKILREIQEICYNNGTNSLLVNVKMLTNKTGNVTIDDKLDKYR